MLEVDGDDDAALPSTESCRRRRVMVAVFVAFFCGYDSSILQGAAGKCDFCHFFGAPTSKSNEKSISRIINFCLSSTFLREFYRVRKIDRTFDLSSKHRFGLYGIHGDMYAYIVVKYVYPIILIVSSPGLQCRSSMDDILPFSLPSENLENDAF
jgi:hypothetical protein